MANTVIYQKRGAEKVKVAETPDLSPYAIKADVDTELAEKADAEDLGITNKRVDNLSALLNGALSVQQTDSTSAYSKTVPSKAQPFASIDAIGGETVCWNQLVTNGNFATASNWSLNSLSMTVADNVATFEVTAQASFVSFYQVVPATEGHKYLATIDLRTDSETAQYLTLAVMSKTVYENVSENWTTVATIVESPTPGNKTINPGMNYPIASAAVIGDKIYARNARVVDLTLLYGPGNEPSTVAEFQAQFPTIDPAYNAGQLISAGVTGAVSVGKNILPLPADMTPITNYGVTITPNPDGSYTLSGTPTGAGSVTFQLTHSYTLLGDGSQYVHLRNNEVNGNINFIIGKHSNGADWGAVPGTQNRILSITAPYQTVTQIKIYWNANVGTLSNFTFQPSIEATSATTDFTPYMTSSLPILAAVQALPGYGWSAGTAYNEVDWVNKKYIQRVGSVDLGTLTWTYTVQTGDGYIPFFQCNAAIPLSATPVQISDANRICPRFTNLSSYSIVYGKDTSVDKVISMDAATTSVTIRIRDTAYSDAAAFKAAMSGMMVYYELATPVITDISQYITDDNLLQVEPGGTISFPSALGDDYRIPVPSDIEYTIDMAPDTPSTDGAYTLQCTVTDGVPTYSWVSA